MKHLLLSWLLMTVVSLSMAQTTHYVKQNGTGNGSSWADAAGDLQATITAASSGDSVFVAGGIYQRAVGQFFTMQAGVKIYGSFAGTENSLNDRRLASGDTSVLLGNGAGVVRNESTGLNASAVLDGFKITGGNANANTNGGHGGGGVYIQGNSPTLSHLVITGNTTNYYGGGIEINGGSPTLTSVIISGNTAPNYGGGGISFDNCASVFTNILIIDNSAADGGAIMGTGGLTPTFTNATVTGNKSVILAGGIHAGSPLIMNNSIIWGNISADNGGNDIFIDDDILGNIVLHYCLYGNDANDIVDFNNQLTATDNNLTVDPQFVNPAGGNYHLSSNSPAINKGSNGYIAADDTVDVAGNQRIYNKNGGGIADIGAYEYHPIHPTNGILYVDSAASAEGDGSSWEKALPSLMDALAATDTIQPPYIVEQLWVAKGTYQPGTGQSFAMRPNLKIYGSFKGTEASLGERRLAMGDSSILKGNGASVIRNDRNGLNSAAVLDGFKITGGVATGINSANYGGGIYNRSVSPTLSHLVITGNTATDVGGGMLNDNGASPTLSNIIFSSNTANNRGGGGIANYSASNPVLLNVTISGNQASGASGSGGGMLNNGSAPVLTNCIIWGNTATNQGNEVSFSISSVVLYYSLYKNGPNDVVGIGSITADHSKTEDPLFVDAAIGNYALQASSPGINTGDNTALFVDDTLDLAGNPRIYDKISSGVVDMGAYEYQGAIALPVRVMAFTGSIRNNVATLSWQSGVETGFNHYELEKSTDGKTFFALASIQAQGSGNSYTFSATQTDATTYYRLKAVDNDGTTLIYNKFVTLSLSGLSTSIVLYPNPAKDHINLKVAIAGSCRIYDAGGRRVKMQDLRQGENYIDISNLSAGVYYIVVGDTKIQFIKG